MITWNIICISRMEGILGKINVCKTYCKNIRYASHFHRLWQFFMTFVFYFFFGRQRRGEGTSELSKFDDKAFRGPLRFKQAICRVHCVQCDRKLTGYKWLKHRLENMPFSFLERVMGFHEILSTILQFSNYRHGWWKCTMNGLIVGR